MIRHAGATSDFFKSFLSHSSSFSDKTLTKCLTGLPKDRKRLKHIKIAVDKKLLRWNLVKLFGTMDFIRYAQPYTNILISIKETFKTTNSSDYTDKGKEMGDRRKPREDPRDHLWLLGFEDADKLAQRGQ